MSDNLEFDQFMNKPKNPKLYNNKYEDDRYENVINVMKITTLIGLGFVLGYYAKSQLK